jgi:hypothetical protein
MSLAIPLMFEAGILFILVYGLSIEIREPRLDVSGRDEDRHAFILAALFPAFFDAGAFNLPYSGSNLFQVSIDQHNQRLLNSVPSFSVVG